MILIWGVLHQFQAIIYDLIITAIYFFETITRAGRINRSFNL